MPWCILLNLISKEMLCLGKKKREVAEKPIWTILGLTDLHEAMFYQKILHETWKIYSFGHCKCNNCTVYKFNHWCFIAKESVYSHIWSLFWLPNKLNQGCATSSVNIQNNYSKKKNYSRKNTPSQRQPWNFRSNYIYGSGGFCSSWPPCP